jgi:hypothetical protein
MVTQIILKTEGPHELPKVEQTQACRSAEVDPGPPWRRSRYAGAWPGLIILADYDCSQRLRVPLERTEPYANAAARERGEWSSHTGTASSGPGHRAWPGTTYQALQVQATFP